MELGFLFCLPVQMFDLHLSNLLLNGQALRECKEPEKRPNYNDDHFVSIDYALL